MGKPAQAVYTAQFITLQKLKEQIHGDEEYVLHSDYMRDVDALQSRLTRLEAAVQVVIKRYRTGRATYWLEPAIVDLEHALAEPQGGGE